MNEEIMEKIRAMEWKLKELEKEVHNLGYRISKVESKVSTLLDATYILMKEREERKRNTRK